MNMLGEEEEAEVPRDTSLESFLPSFLPSFLSSSPASSSFNNETYGYGGGGGGIDHLIGLSLMWKYRLDRLQ